MDDDEVCPTCGENVIMCPSCMTILCPGCLNVIPDKERKEQIWISPTGLIHYAEVWSGAVIKTLCGRYIDKEGEGDWVKGCEDDVDGRKVCRACNIKQLKRKVLNR